MDDKAMALLDANARDLLVASAQGAGRLKTGHEAEARSARRGRGNGGLRLREARTAACVRLSPGRPDVIDIRKLYAQTGVFTYDPGFTSTASCESAITYIDGDEGVLLYRGYPIDQLAEQSNFLEVCYLLLNGELPTGQRSWPISTTRSPATPWCTSSCAPSLRASAATRTRWRSCAAWSARCRPSITTRPTSTIRTSA
jgi:hypothetical protein